MKRLLVFACIMLAGCVAPNDAPLETSNGAAAAASEDVAVAVPPQVSARVLEEAMTRGTSVNLSVSTTGSVSVDVILNGTKVDGGRIETTRVFTVPLPYGQTVLEARFSAPGLERTDSFSVVRLGPTGLTIDYGVFHPSAQGEPKSDVYEVWIDVSARPSAPMYVRNHAKNLDAFTAHDQLVLFEAMSTKKVQYSWNAQFQQFGVDRIDGAGSPVASSTPPWWCYSVNGEAADGISIQPIMPGDNVVWRLGTCS